MSNLTLRNGTYYPIQSLTVDICIIFFSCIGVISNFMVCYIVYSRKAIRQPLNCLIANLALSDLIHSFTIGVKFAFPLFVRSFSIAHAISSEIVDIICGFIVFIIFITIGNSMWSLAVISMERCRAILYPLKFSNNKRKMTIIFIFIWTTALICGTLLTIGREYHNLGAIDCSGTLTAKGSLSSAILNTVYSAIALAVPFIIMVVCYTIIAIKLCEKSVPMDDCQYKKQVQKSEQKKTVCIISLMIITLLTAVAGSPFSLLFNWISFQKAYDRDILQKMPRSFWNSFYLCAIFTLVPNILNPILYNFASRTFRKEFIKSLQSLSFHIRSHVSFLQSKKLNSV